MKTCLFNLLFFIVLFFQKYFFENYHIMVLWIMTQLSIFAVYAHINISLSLRTLLIIDTLIN